MESSKEEDKMEFKEMMEALDSTNQKRQERKIEKALVKALKKEESEKRKAEKAIKQGYVIRSSKPLQIIRRREKGAAQKAESAEHVKRQHRRYFKAWF